MKPFLQNYIQAPVSRFHSSSTSEFYLFIILISIHLSSTFLNRRPLCEVDLSSVIVKKGISVAISLPGLIARQYEITNSKSNYLNPQNSVSRSPAEHIQIKMVWP